MATDQDVVGEQGDHGPNGDASTRVIINNYSALRLHKFNKTFVDHLYSALRST